MRAGVLRWIDSGARAIKAAGVVIVLVLLLSGLSPGPARAVDANAVSQGCVEAALARPQVEHAEMRHAGLAGVQNLFARVVSPEVPSDCSDVLRVQRFIFKVQDAKHRAHWDPGLRGFTTFAVGNEAAKNAVYATADDSGRGLYKCTPGPRTTGAEVTIRLIAQEVGTHKPLAKRDYKAPIRRIVPKRC